MHKGDFFNHVAEIFDMVDDGEMECDFSGVQIENIARHYAIDAILHGNAVPTA